MNRPGGEIQRSDESWNQDPIDFLLLREVLDLVRCIARQHCIAAGILAQVVIGKMLQIRRTPDNPIVNVMVDRSIVPF